MRGAMDSPKTAESINTPQCGKVEIIPGPGQQKLEAAASVALHALIQRNDRLTTAMSEVLKELECGNTFEAKKIAEKALHDL